jgi:hypothetical protein
MIQENLENEKKAKNRTMENKRYYEKHKKEQLLRVKDYYDNTKRGSRVHCKCCDCDFYKVSLKAHLKTKTHLKNLKNFQSELITEKIN